jgi:zinc D-Ala-D-Ala dipeptidase
VIFRELMSEQGVASRENGADLGWNLQFSGGMRVYYSIGIWFRSFLLLLVAAVTASNVYGKSVDASIKADEVGVSNSLQMLVVTTKNWDEMHGVAQRYERSNLTSKWHAVGTAFPVVVGKTGLGWGRGIQPSTQNVSGGPSKHEGDGRAPAGVFPITNSFGYSPKPLSGVTLPYITLTSSIECVDDPNSRHYNQLINAKDVNKDWNSFEQMRRDDELYRWGAFVAHNSDPAVRGAGSCIFLHVWGGPDQGTVGCTAMERNKIESLLRWLDPTKRPVLVQLPDAEYLRHTAAWLLPRRAH